MPLGDGMNSINRSIFRPDGVRLYVKARHKDILIGITQNFDKV